MIYFVRSDVWNRIKIGMSSRLSARLLTLKWACGHDITLIGVLPGGRSEEVALHRMFSHLHDRAEWFRPEPELMAYIQDHAIPWDGVDERAPLAASATEQIRIPADVAFDARIVAVANGESLSEYVSRLILQALQHDLGTTADYADERAKARG